MKKYCPFCDSELSQTLWCEQCRRYAILYNTHGAAAEDTCDDNETERTELYRRLTAALKNLYAAKSKPSASIPASRPILPAVPADSGQNPKKDILKIIFITFLLLVCFNLCLALCAYLVKMRGAEPSGTARSTHSDAESRHDAERASVDEPSAEAGMADWNYDIQVTSRKYADDVVQNTLSISRPKLSLLTYTP